MDKYRLLLVEDDLFLRDLYTETLQSAGYTLDTAANGQEAYDKMKKGGYDLVLLDIVLPIMDGIEIMRKLKDDPVAGKNKCVVFLTNLDNEADIKAALELGSGYIIKSQITPADLLNEVKVYLEKINNSVPGSK
ncbi:MAG TPA: response regulator [Patescibacteria group bacterium]|nr:response regulator [Patescibacteria group bacterium]